MTIFTGPSSTMITSMICDGSAIDAKRLRTSTRSNRFAARSRAGDRLDRRVVERHADAHVREPADLLVGRGGVALDLDGGDGFCRLAGADVRGACRGRVPEGRANSSVRTSDRRPHGQRYLMPTLLVTLGTR